MITLQQFITWRKAHDYRATVRTRAQMDAFTGLEIGEVHYCANGQKLYFILGDRTS